MVAALCPAPPYPLYENRFLQRLLTQSVMWQRQWRADGRRHNSYVFQLPKTPSLPGPKEISDQNWSTRPRHTNGFSLPHHTNLNREYTRTAIYRLHKFNAFNTGVPPGDFTFDEARHHICGIVPAVSTEFPQFWHFQRSSIIQSNFLLTGADSTHLQKRKSWNCNICFDNGLGKSKMKRKA